MMILVLISALGLWGGLLYWSRARDHLERANTFAAYRARNHAGMLVADRDVSAASQHLSHFGDSYLREILGRHVDEAIERYRAYSLASEGCTVMEARYRRAALRPWISVQEPRIPPHSGGDEGFIPAPQ
ncbi:hypothetical protein [Tautonia plasticadhaerens]|uniref:Uncharacterized protein n=1 Tax=Tautonia plasticadhaerens TaxID=2527974 RepID=A0A518GVT8_9BACT|nr:hypothetical protein [Tautonia plasticadhaerens]QDV32679.1 hypothetical protein ElP_05140 [Tautonia plasticadhaerens]